MFRLKQWLGGPIDHQILLREIVGKEFRRVHARGLESGNRVGGKSLRDWRVRHYWRTGGVFGVSLFLQSAALMSGSSGPTLGFPLKSGRML